MAEVRKYFCCTDNLTGCKIIGGVEFVLNAILLIISIIELSQIPAYVRTLAIIAAVILGLKILCTIFLLSAVKERSATMLMVWIVLNGVFIVLPLVGLFSGGGPVAIIQSLVSIGLGIWAELIAIGAREEVKSYQSIGAQRSAERRSGAAVRDPESTRSGTPQTEA